MAEVPASAEYATFVEAVKGRVRQARLTAILAVNKELILLYWQIGREILIREEALGWGAKVIDRLSRDLKRAFPDMRGFSTRNLRYIRAFSQAWPDEEFVQQAVAQIPWGHNTRLLDKVDEEEARRFYVHKTIEHGWSRSMLMAKVESRLHERQGQATSNFKRVLPPAKSDLAQQLTRDPYCFDFLTLAEDARERDLERGLVRHIRDFLVELGVGFAFMGTEVKLDVGGQEYFLDLLFYHVKLRCYVIVELKAGAFKPEYAGKLNFYLSTADELLRHPQDGPSIGLLLCKSKNDLVVEYALRGLDKPMGVARWEAQLVESLPAEFQGSLPTVEELEAELSDEERGDDAQTEV